MAAPKDALILWMQRVEHTGLEVPGFEVALNAST